MLLRRAFRFRAGRPDRTEVAGRVEPITVPGPARENLVVLGSSAFSVAFTGLEDFTGYTVHAHVRAFHDSASTLTQFVVVPTLVAGSGSNPATTNVVLTLTREQTFKLPRQCFWDMQLMDVNLNVHTIMEGQFTTEKQGAF